MKSIAELEKRIHYLEKENQYLKHLLSVAGISCSEKEIDNIVNEYAPNQGSRIIPREITEADAKVFFSMFWGCTDYTTSLDIFSKADRGRSGKKIWQCAFK